MTRTLTRVLAILLATITALTCLWAIEPPQIDIWAVLADAMTVIHRVAATIILATGVVSVAVAAWLIGGDWE